MMLIVQVGLFVAPSFHLVAVLLVVPMCLGADKPNLHGESHVGWLHCPVSVGPLLPVMSVYTPRHKWGQEARDVQLCRQPVQIR